MMGKILQRCRGRSIVTNPVGWADAAVGTPARFLFVCISSALFGVLAILAVRVHVRAVELRMEMGDVASRFEQATFLLVCGMIVVGTTLLPVVSWYAVRRLLQEIKRKGKADSNT